MIGMKPTILLTMILILGIAIPLRAQLDQAPESNRGALEIAYQDWTDSLVDDGTWELQMPSTKESEDIDHLHRTLLDPARGTELKSGIKAGYLVALADRTALAGDRARARSLYHVLESSSVPLLEMWASYMLAGLDFAEGNYSVALLGYDRVCSESAPADWRDHACTMVGLAGRLDTLQIEGGDHGDPVTETP